MVPEPIVITEIRKLLSTASVAPEDVDKRCWSLLNTKLEEALLWGKRAIEKGATNE